MKLISTAIGIGIAAWALSRALRQAEHSRRRQGTGEAVTRWEGEGGAIPEFEPRAADSYGNRGVAA